MTVILISFSFVLKPFFVMSVVIETGSHIFPVWELFEVPLEEKTWVAVLGITSECLKFWPSSVFLHHK